MRIEDAVKSMSKQYLGRILDSFTRDLEPMDEESARDFIIRAVPELTNEDHVRKRLAFERQPHSQRVLVGFVLQAVINAPECRLEESALLKAVVEEEERLLADAKSGDALQYADDDAVRTYQVVATVAANDDEISVDEYRLLERLRRHLKLTRRQQRLIEARIDAIPKAGGELHSFGEIKEVVRMLERAGVLFHCNLVDGDNEIVLPEELTAPVKAAMGIELSEKATELLWQNLSNAALQEILRDNGLPVSGTKDTLAERLVAAEIPPSEGLSTLTNETLYDVCSSLPGVRVSGTKSERIQRVVDHFDNLRIRETAADAEPAEVFLQYFDALARRDRQNLYANKIINKDIDIERAFEEATRFLFRTRFGHELIEMAGSDHADGGVQFQDGTLLLWDNKSTEEPYGFPNSHLNQFKRYIRDEHERRVAAFLIVVGEAGRGIEDQCLKLKFQSNQDTDVAVVAAEDLLWLADEWENATSDRPLNLSILNQTGVLSRARLEQTLRIVS